MNCPTCGREMPLASTQCSRCGAMLGFAVPSTANVPVSPDLYPGWRLRSVQGIGAAAVVAVGLGALARAVLDAFPWYADTVGVLLTENAATLLTVGVVSTGVIATVLTIIWLWRARQNLNAFVGAAPRWAAGWTIGAWFIPCASIVLIPIVVADVARHTFGPRRSGLVVALVWVWGSVQLLTVFVGSDPYTLVRLMRPDRELTQVGSLAVTVLLVGLELIAGALQIVYIQLISKTQTDRMRPALTVATV